MRGLDSGISEHVQRRANLIAAERSLRFDAGVIASATEKEKRAVEIVNQIRVREAQEIWNATEGTLMPPSKHFLVAKDIIMNTELYQVVKQLPKGGLLRGHANTMCDVSFIYKIALDYPAIHIRLRSRITPDAPLPLPEIKPMSPDLIIEYTNGPSLTCPDYVPGTWVSLSKARSEFSYGGPEAFDKWILGLLAFGADDRIKDYEMLDQASLLTLIPSVRGKLISGYRLARGIVCYEPVLKRFLRQILLSLVEDSVCYAEIRGNFSYKADVWEDGSETLSHRDYLVLFNEAVQEVKAQMKSEGREDEFIGAKVAGSTIHMQPSINSLDSSGIKDDTDIIEQLVYTVYRTIDKEKLRWYLEDCMALKTEFPDLIAGFDFLGPENIGKPLAYYLEELIWFQQETKKRGLDIPFIFLVGEPMGDENKADNNLYDALLLGAKRIGHGFNLAKHPLLMQMAKDRGVAVEVCPVSNEILGFTSPIHHPITALMNHGVPVVLCPDNPATYGHAGLSFDFFQASFPILMPPYEYRPRKHVQVIVGSTTSDLLTLKQLAKHSLEYSSLNTEDKKEAQELWEKRWTAFVDRIVSGNPESKH